jgi:acetyl-CoA acyltransferase
MGLTAEKVAQQWKVSREAQDAFALQSHLRAWPRKGRRVCRRDHAGRSDRPHAQPGHRRSPSAPSTRTVSLDEGPRPDTSLEGLAKLRTVFAARGSVTAGNSSQTSDGAGALILASEKAVKRLA